MGLMAVQTFQKNKIRLVNSKDIAIETTQNKTQKEKRTLRNEKNITELWDNFKQPNIWSIGIYEGEEGEEETKCF